MKTARKTILLVDDDPDFLSLVQEAMQSDGYQVITKTDGYTALSVIDGGTDVDVVITDYNMPGMSGLKFLSALRSRVLSAPVIMLSAFGTVETYLKAMHLGAYEFVNKPVKMEELKAIIESALNSPVPNVRRPLAGGTKPKQRRFEHP